MSFVIATDSRKRDEILFMVDRRRQKASFCSNRTVDAFIFADKRAADRKAKSLKHNNPRVMPLAHAQRIVNSKELDRIHQVGMDCVEAGWDGHKSIFG
jgi:hypothetical protein